MVNNKQESKIDSLDPIRDDERTISLSRYIPI